MTGITLKTRIRDAELSVRTSNLLCKTFGEDVTFERFEDSDLPEEREQLRTLLGARGLGEFRECLHAAESGSQQKSVRAQTKTLRDEFAMIVDRDEFGDLTYRGVSRDLSEELLGRTYPEEGSPTRRRDILQWEIDLRARLRFMFADAMMEARGK